MHLADVDLAAIGWRLDQEAHHLRPPYPLDKPGYVVRQLCLQALQGGYSELADQARQELLTLPAARLIPRWTNIRALRALVRTLTGHDGWVTAVAITPDGTQAVTAGGYDKTLRRWDRRSSPERLTSPLTVGGDLGKRWFAQR